MHIRASYELEDGSCDGGTATAQRPDSNNNNHNNDNNSENNDVDLRCGIRCPEPGTKLTREERRRRRRATQKYRLAHASRERVRVEAFNIAFRHLRQLLPTLPPNRKLSKIEILRLAICYISYLSHILEIAV